MGGDLNDARDTPEARVSGAQAVDARHSVGLLIGDNNSALVYKVSIYNGIPDRPAPAPLITAGGLVEFPYRGLGWFGEQDAPLFFGREHAIADVMDHVRDALDTPRIVALGGVSGSGKSSLVRAGVIPRIRGEIAAPQRWPSFVVFSPGSSPLADLAIATARATGLDAAMLQQAYESSPASFAASAAQATAPNSATPPNADRRLLVVVDQFERIFTQCADPVRRERFVTALHAAATTPDSETGKPAALILVVVRSDFEARCAELTALTDSIRHRALLTSMTERQLRLAITEPAKTADTRVEDELTEQLLREIRIASQTADADPAGPFAVSGAGVLPLVSDALDRAWRGRSGSTLTLADYDRVGGIERAVADAAGSVYDKLTAPRQRVARAIFTRLTVIGSDGIETADRVRRSELAATAGDAADVDAVLEAFANERLLALGDDSVEISHEVLLSTWPLLRDHWLADTRADRAVRTRLRSAASLWQQHGEDYSYLYTGSALLTATATTARLATDPRHHIALTDLEHRFLAASTRADRRRTVQRRAYTTAAALLVVCLTIVTVFAVQKAQESDEQRRVAVARDLVSRSQLLADTDPIGTRLAALAAWRIHESDETRHAMRVAALSPLVSVIADNDRLNQFPSFSPAGDIVATYAGDGPIRLWDIVTGTERHRLPDTNGDFLVFSPGGDVLATYGSGSVRLWDSATGTKLHEFPAVTAGNTPEFSPDGRLLGTADRDSVHLWNTLTGAELHRLPDTGDHSMKFSPAGDVVATYSDDKPVRLWDTLTGTELHALAETSDDFPQFAPTGGLLVTSAGSGTPVRLWNIVTGAELHRFPGMNGHAPVFSPTGEVLATDDGTGVRVWDTATGTERVKLPGVDGHPPVFSPTGEVLATDDGTGVRLWDTATGTEMNRLSDITGDGPVFSPDGGILVTQGGEGVRLWDATTGAELDQVPGHSPQFSHDGDLLATLGGDSFARFWRPSKPEPVDELPDRINDVLATEGTANTPVRLWDAVTGAVRRELPGTNSNQPLLSPGGTVLATYTSYHGVPVRLWDTITGVQLHQLPDTADNSAKFSPDSRVVATYGSGDIPIRLWDTATGAQLLQLPDTAGHYPLFSPGGDILATEGPSHPLRLWMISTGTELHQLGTESHSMVFSPSGGLLATSGTSVPVRLFDTITGAAQHRLPDTHGNTAAFSPDDNILATYGHGEVPIRLWDTATGAQLHQLPDTSGDDPIFSPARHILTTINDDGELTLWDTALYREMSTITVDKEASIVFTADGSRLIVTAPGHRARAWDLSFTVDDRALTDSLCVWIARTQAPNQWTQGVPANLTPQLCP